MGDPNRPKELPRFQRVGVGPSSGTDVADKELRTTSCGALTDAPEPEFYKVMSEKQSKSSTSSKAPVPDARRRALLKGAIKGAAIGAPMVMTLKSGRAWAHSAHACVITQPVPPLDPTNPAYLPVCSV